MAQKISINKFVLSLSFITTLLLFSPLQVSAQDENIVDKTGDLYLAGTTLTPPVLTADTTENAVGQTIDLTFIDDAAWRSAISDVTVNTTSIAGHYTLAAGILTIDYSVFTAAADYVIVVKAIGYSDAQITQTITQKPEQAVYILEVIFDPAYMIMPITGDMNMKTVKNGISGLKYFSVQITPVVPHNGLETVVFIHKRNGVQLNLNATRADFDQVNTVQTGFNVQSGDLVQAYIVDNLTNDINFNPTVLQ